MELSQVLKELGRIKHNCHNITFKECVTGCCPYHGKKHEPETDYDDETGETIICTHDCLFSDMGFQPPYEWEIPEEI